MSNTHTVESVIRVRSELLAFVEYPDKEKCIIHISWICHLEQCGILFPCKTSVGHSQCIPFVEQEMMSSSEKRKYAEAEKR